VPVYSATKRLLGIVQMKALDPFQAHHPIELRDRAFVAFGLSDVIAGGEQMAGI
jgi:hypothetical protein